MGGLVPKTVWNGLSKAIGVFIVVTGQSWQGPGLAQFIVLLFFYQSKEFLPVQGRMWGLDMRPLIISPRCESSGQWREMGTTSKSHQLNITLLQCDQNFILGPKCTGYMKILKRVLRRHFKVKILRYITVVGTRHSLCPRIYVLKLSVLPKASILLRHIKAWASTHSFLFCVILISFVPQPPYP